MDQPTNAPSTLPRALVVEDEDIVRELVALVLEDLGVETVITKSADEGLAEFEKDPGAWDLVVTDVMTPGRRNGHDLAWAVAQARPELKIIVLSGYPRNPAKRYPDTATYLVKPWSIPQLQRLVNTAVRRSSGDRSVFPEGAGRFE
ncbi:MULTISPECIES: response regulator [unclassified Pseudomonas]|uniref:response regulator n=1 Tax=unclassified Pseudomonas TaxID=196821 RepID=UPI000BCF5EDB|nr:MULTISPECIES: response regulator [unclassified Pseudomonas]PVZ19889.1 response regulator receiver domain-containing protein [Pseudomonas sp. URIL14HWK12:I12]PVZ26955.1 response regulator receiver domain-containing protein [Pseudomonas sp. URIL14HWK12:I10]PVZ37844.1 response regulator receiver domain-containing protein [Pseudomonas sp. URIL14HWK12:I11]SNZ05441.1 Response regulator containing CheY-like receiver, AAA-type ATPase, and DNA-binding domains [Pseudomonas sp. URIL14HWK12:I9]